MEYLIQGETLSGIADEVRRLSGTEEALAPDEMKEALAAVETGGSSEKIAAIADGSITELTAEDFGNISSIKSYAFHRCKQLTQLELPDSINNIGEEAFSQCTRLEYIKMPYSLSIGYNSFYNCAALDTLEFTVGSGRVVSGTSNFPNKYVKNIIFGSGITTIAASLCAVNGSTVVSVHIPVTVTSVEQAAFNFCSKLTDVYYEGTEAEWAAISVASSNDYLLNATIHYNTPM